MRQEMRVLRRTATTKKTLTSKFKPALSQNMLQAAALCVTAAVLMFTHNARKRSLHHGHQSNTLRRVTICWPPAVSPSCSLLPAGQIQQPDSPAEQLRDHQAFGQRILVSVLPTESEACNKALQAALQRMLPDSEGLLGLDAEWDSTANAADTCPVALLQLSTAEECLLIQMGLFQGEIPASLIQLLEDSRVLKAGLGIAEDVRRLQLGFGIYVQGTVDIRQVADTVIPSLVLGPSAHGNISLRSLTEMVLGLHLDKSLQRSAWGEQHLTDAQVTYAAHDAWASRQILVDLVDQIRQQQQQQLPQTAPHESLPQVDTRLPTSLDGGLLLATIDLSNVNHDSQSHHALLPATWESLPHPQPNMMHSTISSAHIQPLSDILAPFVLRSSSIADSVTGTGVRSIQAKQRLLSNSQHQSTPEQEQQQTVVQENRATRQARLSAAADIMAASLLACASASSQDHSSSEGQARECGGSLLSPFKGSGGKRKEVKALGKQPVLYDNCSIQAPDGQLLCTCSIKKARWYLSMGLATEIASEPLRIQLSFEPQGRNASTDAYETTAKSNHCCVCGADDDYGRHAVVPRCYRQHFPLQYKSHMAHDILPMCRRCEQRCSSEDHRRMKALGVQYGAPLDVVKFIHDGDLGKVRSAARALIKSQGRIPPARQAELMQLLQQHFHVETVDKGMIQSAAQEDPRIANTDWSSHAEVLVAALNGPDAIEVFVRGWRQHFLDTMLPTHLPLHWSVTARVCMDHAQSCVKTDKIKGPPGGENCWTGALQE